MPRGWVSLWGVVPELPTLISLSRPMLDPGSPSLPVEVPRSQQAQTGWVGLGWVQQGMSRGMNCPIPVLNRCSNPGQA